MNRAVRALAANWGRALAAALFLNLLVFACIPLLAGKPERPEYQARSSPVRVVPHVQKPRPRPRAEPTVRPKPISPPVPQSIRTRPMPPSPRPKIPCPPMASALSLDMPPITPALDLPALPDLPVTPQGPRGFELGQVDTPPSIQYRVAPVYPYAARSRNLTGCVTLRFLVGEDGTVTHLDVVKAAPPGVFEANAAKAVNQWRFSPGILNGRPVPTWVEVPIRFDLSG